MNFDGYAKQAIPRFGSLVQWDAPVRLPYGLANTARNVRYTAESVGSRWGLSQLLKFGNENSKVAGFTCLRYLSSDNTGTEVIKAFAYTQADGNLWAATPWQQNTVTQLTTSSFFTNTGFQQSQLEGLYPVLAQAFNRGYAALGNMMTGIGKPLVYDPNYGYLDQASDKPVGVPWNPNTLYRVGQVVSPSTFQTNGLPVEQGVWVASNFGHFFRCIQTGNSDPTTQPAWTTTPGQTYNDGTVRWEESTPFAGAGLPDPNAAILGAISADPSSPIVSTGWVFIALTYVNAQGESINVLGTPEGTVDTTKVLQYFNNTGVNVDVAFQMPAIPAELAAGGPLGANGATGYNVYAYITAPGPDIAKILDPSFYAQVATNQAAGATLTISAFPTGPALPTINTAYISNPGNVDVGQRWMVVFYETRTEYQTGFGATSPILVNVTASGRQLLVDNLPIGPYNTIARICAFTVAGASAAGPYFYVDQNDTESPGFNQSDIPITATRVNDNTTTQIQFNITDSYLPGASEVTDYFNRIEIPQCSDVHFSKSLSRVFYTGCLGYPSGFLVSDFEDPEAVRVPGSVVQCSESDGDRTVCVRSVRDNEVALKENSGHSIVANSGDPSTWNVQNLWEGSGPVGAKAVAVGIEDNNEFLIYAHKTGPYRYTGGAPMLVGRELGCVATMKLFGYWKRINWDVGWKIVVTIDSERREVRFSVPLDEATENSVTFTVNYANGWGDAIAVSEFRNTPKVNTYGRKWSIDDIAPMDSFYVPQRYQQTNTLNVDLNSSLIVAMPDGAIYRIQDGKIFDDTYGGTTAFLAKWIGVPTAGNPQDLAISSLEGCTISGTGSGLTNVYAVDAQGTTTVFTTSTRTCAFTATEQIFDFGMVAVEAVRWGIGFDNGGSLTGSFEVHQAILYTNKLYGARIG